MAKSPSNVRFTVTKEGEVKRFTFDLKGITPSVLIREISDTRAEPDWANDLIGVKMLSYSAKEDGQSCSIVFLITDAFGSISNKTTIVEDLIDDCLTYLLSEKKKQSCWTKPAVKSAPVPKNKPASKKIAGRRK